jgi:hypothetical protein
MVHDPLRQDDLPAHAPMAERSHGSGLVFTLVALALVLAIGFFYVTNESRDDRRADAVTQAADSVDRAASRAGDAARNAADSPRQDN